MPIDIHLVYHHGWTIWIEYENYTKFDSWHCHMGDAMSLVDDMKLQYRIP